jgi:fibronectin-binding autotransporter adhesin
MLKLLMILCSTLATTAVFGQTTYVWTNQNPAHLVSGDFDQGTNWAPNGVPQSNTGPDPVSGVYGDTAMFDGQTTGPLSLTDIDSNAGGGSGNPLGIHIILSANQTNPVTIYSPVAVSSGLRFANMQVQAGGLILGDHSVNCLDFVGGTLNGQIQGFTNNSSTPCVVNETCRWRMGGGGSHPFVFAGTGDWIVNNHMRSANQSSIQVQKDGPGTMTWTGTNTANANFPDSLGNPVRVFAGTMIIKTSDLLNAGSGGPGIVQNGALLKFDIVPGPGLATGPDTIPGTISGAGPIQMNAGTITLSGPNTFTGNINLTGGELIAGSAESVGVNGPLGQNGTISFNGGTLGWNLANAFDYSSRFDTSAGQTYNLDTGGSSPIFVTGLTSSGAALNKLGGGTLTLAGANTYTGPTTVSVGELLFQGTKSGNANITVADGATLGVVENGSQITPGTLTLGTSTGANLEFNNVTNHTLATIAPSTLVSTGTVIITINSGRFFAIGDTFPLLKWTSGTAPAVSLGFLAGAGGHLATNGNQINLVIDDPPYVWTGLNSATWDTTTVNWTRSGLPVTWVNAHYALLDDTGNSPNVTLSGTISPTNATINNSTLAYAITSSPGNVIGGGGGLTKNGSGTLTLPGGANTYSGVTTVGGGVLGVSTLANGGSASDIGASSSGATNIVLNGGTLQYTGSGASVDRLFTVGGGGGTIDSEGSSALVFNNTGSLGMNGNGPRTLTLTGSSIFGDTIASVIVNHPAGTSLTKNGSGVWVLTGNNTYAGGTAILGGGLQVGTGPFGVGGPSGTVGSGNISTATGTGIDFDRTGTLTVSGAISGGGTVTLDGTGTIILANNNSYTGGTFINAGTLQVGNGGGSGSLYSFGAIVNNSLLVFNTAGSFSYSAAGLISGTGNVIAQGGGVVKVVGANTYTGWTRIDSGTTFWPREGQDGLLASSAVTNNGTLRIVSQDSAFTYPGPIVGSGNVQIGANNVNVGVITFTGTNTYTGGTFIGDNTLTLGDGSTPQAGAIVGNVTFANNFTTSQDNTRTLLFNRPDNFTFSGNIMTNFATPQNNRGIVQLNGSGTVTLTGPTNTYGGGTIVNGGALVIGNGGSSGSVGFGSVALNSGNPLVINRTGSLTIWDNITGSSDVVIMAGPTVTWNGTNNSFIGATTVSNGTLIVNGFSGSSLTHVYVGGLGGTGTYFGPITLDPGTSLSVGGASALGALTAQSDLTLNATNISVQINKLLSPSNSLINVSGALARTVTGGTLTVHNQGPQNLVPGNKFTLFSQPLPNGASITVTGGRATWVNNLAVDGSISVATVITSQPKLNYTSTSTNLTFSWSDPNGPFKLQVETNRIGITTTSTNWVDYPNGGTSPVTVPLVKTNLPVFFRIVSVP